MSRPYSQAKALWAITRASFKAIFAQPTSVVFSLLFPIIFILIFGAFGKDGIPTARIAFAPTSDTANALFDSIRSSRFVRISRFADTAEMRSELMKGRLTAIVDVDKLGSDSGQYHVKIHSTNASGNTLYIFLQTVDNMALRHEAAPIFSRKFIVHPIITEGQQYRQIDFVLPGQLGFSLLFATLFGVAFTFFTLREQLILKRFYASPVSRLNILIGIGASRLFFQVLNVVVLILFGHYFLDFTLQHGAITFFEMVLMSVYMLFLLMGVGLIFSSVAKTDTSIPLLINLFGFPQMLLSGTFFPITVFPKWMQDVCQILPLTQFNDAMRLISFEGKHIWHCWEQIGVLGIWMVVIYLIVGRVIKWE